VGGSLNSQANPVARDFGGEEAPSRTENNLYGRGLGNFPGETWATAGRNCHGGPRGGYLGRHGRREKKERDFFRGRIRCTARAFEKMFPGNWNNKRPEVGPACWSVFSRVRAAPAQILQFPARLCGWGLGAAAALAAKYWRSAYRLREKKPHVEANIENAHRAGIF